MYLTQGLHRALQQFPDKTAFVCGSRRTTYRELAGRVARFAGGLQGLGLQASDRVAMLALNSDRYVEYYLGTWWAGGVANPVNTRWSVSEIAFSIEDCGTRILIVDAHFAHLVPAIRQATAGLEHVILVEDAGVGASGAGAGVDAGASDEAGGEARPSGVLDCETWLAAAHTVDDARSHGDDLAAILYTGGTTGFPKGVMLSHTNLWSSAIARMAQVPMPQQSVALQVAPMFHTAALGKLVTQIICGATGVILPAFRPAELVRTIEEESVDDVMLVPSMLQMILDDPAFDGRRLRSLRRLTYGASPMSIAVLERAMAALPQVEFFHAYGMTEAAPVVSINPPENHGPEGRDSGRYKSAGRAGYGVEVRVIDAEGKEAPRGTVGEIVVRGPNVMLGYWNRPAETAAALRDGWLHTGDGAWMDEAGYLYIVDRIKDMIVTGGENVYSAEVENVLSRHPAVMGCAVVGVPHEQWGESVHAVVVLRDGTRAGEDELLAFCRERLGGYKCPKSFEFVDALPMSPTGKVLKHELREPYWRGTLQQPLDR